MRCGSNLRDVIRVEGPHGVAGYFPGDNSAGIENAEGRKEGITGCKKKKPDKAFHKVGF